MEDYFQEILNSKISLTAHMGVKVKKIDSAETILWAPLLPNKNHKETAFGGSLASTAMLCGWCLLMFFLLKRNLDSSRVVLADTHIKFLAPVEEDFQAVCRPSEDNLKKFYEKLITRGKASINLEVSIFSSGKEAVKMSGVYVAVLGGFGP
ncbi:MAG TPA: thioesterase [Peptococcaceae bacterium]|nr:MAG: Thioesterase-like protein [Clostridia bacterium 41_269]HBT20811.1 thioesterase [Peptococcaceae bacterium]